MKPSEKSYLKIKLCVSGAAETGHCAPDALKKAKELDKESVLYINEVYS